ncbi:hypothetical protein BDR26DRAFT_872562 [Obelidium mucronatum]|nr:hypothetical protein BDR26DRAFT_872562 [Obelidium mucronatum]
MNTLRELSETPTAAGLESDGTIDADLGMEFERLERKTGPLEDSDPSLKGQPVLAGKGKGKGKGKGAKGGSVAGAAPKEKPAKTEGEAKIPRPPNAFILYRSDNQPKLVQSFVGQGKSSRDFSALIGLMWKEATPAVKDHYQALAAERMKDHREKFPGYKYRPAHGPRGDADLNSKDKDNKDKDKDKELKPKDKKRPAADATAAANAGDAKRARLEAPGDLPAADSTQHIHKHPLAQHTPLSSCSVISTPIISPVLTGTSRIQASIESIASMPSSPCLSSKSGIPALLEYQDQLTFLNQKLKELVEANDACLQRCGIPILSNQ